MKNKILKNNLITKSIALLTILMLLLSLMMPSYVLAEELPTIKLNLNDTFTINPYEYIHKDYKNKEINFIAKKEKDLSYYQISYKIRDEKTRERIYETYNSVTDNFPKYVLSMDHSNFSQDGIIHKNIIDFLLEDEGVKWKISK